MVSHRIKTIKNMRRNFQNYFDNVGAPTVTNADVTLAYEMKDLNESRRLLAVDSYKKMVPFFLLGLSRLEDMWLKATKTVGEYLLIIFKQQLIQFYVLQLGYSQAATAAMVDNLLLGITLDGASDIMCTSTQAFINQSFINEYETINIEYKTNTGSIYYQESNDRTLFEAFSDILGNVIYGLPNYMLNQQDIKDYIIANAEIQTTAEDSEHELAQENTERTIECIHQFFKAFLTEESAMNVIQESVYPKDNWQDTNLLNHIKQLAVGDGLETTMAEALQTFDQIKHTMYIDDYENLDELFDACDNMSCLVQKYWDVQHTLTPTPTDPNSRLTINLNNVGGNYSINHIVPSKNVPYDNPLKYFKRLSNMKHDLLPAILDQVVVECDMYLNELLWTELHEYKDEIKFLKNRITESIRMFAASSVTHGSESMYYHCDLQAIAPLVSVDSIGSFTEYIHNYNSNALLTDIQTFHNGIVEKIVGLSTMQTINGVSYPVPIYGQIETQLAGMFNTIDADNGLRSLYDVFVQIETIDNSFNKSDLFNDIRYKLFKYLPSVIRKVVSKIIDELDEEMETFMMVYDIRMVESNSAIISSKFFDVLDKIFAPMLTRTASEMTDTIYNSLNKSTESFLKTIYPLMFFNYIYEFELKKLRNRTTTGTISGYTIKEYTTDIHLSTIIKRDVAVITDNKEFLNVDMADEFYKRMIYLGSNDINSSLLHYDYHTLDYDIDYDYDTINISKPIALMHKNNASFITKLKNMEYDVIQSSEMHRHIHKQITDRITSLNYFNLSLGNDAGYNKSLLNYQGLIYYSQLDDEYYLSFDAYKYYPKATVDEIQNVLTLVNTLDHTQTKVLESINPIDDLIFQSTSSWDYVINTSTLKLNGNTQCIIDSNKYITNVIDHYKLYTSRDIPQYYVDMLSDRIKELDEALLHEYDNYSPPKELPPQHFGIIDNSKYNDLFLYYDLYMRFAAINQMNVGNFDPSLNLVHTLFSYEVKERLKRTANSDSLFYTLINA